jgi:hypothetical protein
VVTKLAKLQERVSPFFIPRMGSIDCDLLELGVAIQAELVLDHTSRNLARHLLLRHLMLRQVVGSEMATVDICVEVILVGLRGSDGINGMGLGVEDLVVVLHRSEKNHDCKWERGIGEWRI